MSSRTSSAKVRPVKAKTPAPATSAKSTAQNRALKPVKRVWAKPTTWWHKSRYPAYQPLPKARHIARSALRLVWQGRVTFGLIGLLYALLTIVLVQSAGSAGDLTAINELLGGKQVVSVLPQLGYLFGSVGQSNSAVGGVYQMVLLIIMSLAIIWALRQLGANKPATFKAAFYDGMYPLIPFGLVFLLLSLQIVPMSAALFLYDTVLVGGIATSWLQIGIGLGLIALLLLWTLYMLTATIFAFYIVTLPGMTPLKAYRSAKQLVGGRRLLIWRKLLFLPIVLCVVIILFMLPILLSATVLAPWVFVLLTALSLPVAHAYLYQLYREMIA